MSRVQVKPITNWCDKARPTEQGLCGSDKLSEDGKRHHCDKPSGHTDDLHTCPCGARWKHML